MTAQELITAITPLKEAADASRNALEKERQRTDLMYAAARHLQTAMDNLRNHIEKVETPAKP